MRCLGIAIVFAMGMIASAPAGNASDSEAALGEQIASRECAGCHGLGITKGVVIQGVQVPSFSEIAGRPYQSKERLQSFVSIPRHPMPGIPLTPQEIRYLADYIISLKP